MIHTKINYEENLKKILRLEDYDLKVLRKSFGILRGALKKTPVEIQRAMRKEWERKQPRKAN